MTHIYCIFFLFNIMRCLFFLLNTYLCMRVCQNYTLWRVGTIYCKFTNKPKSRILTHPTGVVCYITCKIKS